MLWTPPLELEMGCCLLDEPRDADINRSCARLEACCVGPDLACSIEVDAQHAEGVGSTSGQACCQVLFNIGIGWVIINDQAHKRLVVCHPETIAQDWLNF